MRFPFDAGKSRKVKQKHGLNLGEAQEIFDQAHLVDRKNDDPAQVRAIGWCGGRLCSVVFEIRKDGEGEYYHLITLESHETGRGSQCRANRKASRSADEIAEMATRGEDVSRFFTNQFPVRRVNVDLTQGMLRELDERAAHLNVSRQAVIKTLLRQALDQSRSDRPPRKRRVG